MPRQLMTGRGVQYVMRHAKEDHGVMLDLGYDKQDKLWNCWAAGSVFFIGRGKTPEAAYENFKLVNNLTTEKQS